MAVIVIGGHARNIGKTSVVCAIIAAMRDKHWTAIKITHHDHNISAAITPEQDPTSSTDSSRYLAAGAARSLLVQTSQLAEAIPHIQNEIAQAENTILESNSILDFLQPDLYATILNPQIADFKGSALQHLDRADALLVPTEPFDPKNWPDVSLNLIKHIPRFQIGPPTFSSPDFLIFIAQKMHNVGK